MLEYVEHREAPGDASPLSYPPLNAGRASDTFKTRDHLLLVAETITDVRAVEPRCVCISPWNRVEMYFGQRYITVQYDCDRN